MKLEIDQQSEEWFDFRRSGIGSSDIAAIMGKCPYSKAIDVFDSKAGFADKKTNWAMERGKNYEDEARRIFNKKKGTNFQPACFRHDTSPHFIASLDGYSDDCVAPAVLEIKIPGRKTFEMIAEGDIPEHYVIQLNWQMYVANCLFGYIAAYLPETGEFAWHAVSPSMTLVLQMVTAANCFWDDYEKGVMPQHKMPKRRVGAHLENQ